MSSPFPGMDPYLEARWSNVHVLMMAAISGLLNATLPPGLEARPEEEVRVETFAGERFRGFRPDVALIETSQTLSPASSSGGSVTATLEPVRLAYHHGPLVLRNIQIVDARDHDRVVTVIEVLSPWNKLPGDLNRAYSAKINTFVEAETNWMEIDLLRSSRSNLPITWDDLPKAKQLEYLILTYNASNDDLLAYPFSVQDPLPRIPVPLRSTDPVITLDLQATMNRVYVDGGFGSINYSIPTVPPLNAKDLKWASDLLVAHATPSKKQSRIDPSSAT